MGKGKVAAVTPEVGQGCVRASTAPGSLLEDVAEPGSTVARGWTRAMQSSPAPARFHPGRQAHLHHHSRRGTPTAPRLSWSTVPFCPNNTASTKDFPDEDTARETEINVNTAKRAGF